MIDPTLHRTKDRELVSLQDYTAIFLDNAGKNVMIILSLPYFSRMMMEPPEKMGTARVLGVFEFGTIGSVHGITFLVSPQHHGEPVVLKLGDAV